MRYSIALALLGLAVGPLRPGSSALPAGQAPSDRTGARWASAEPERWAPQQPYRWSGRLGPGQTLEIKGVNGAVQLLPAAGSEAEVVATRSARRSDPASVEIQRIEYPGGVTICAVYATPPGEEPNECRPGSEGRMSIRDNDVQVRFTVHIPAGVRAVARTVNGHVGVGALDSDVLARTVNGGVDIDRARLADVRTVNGGITATLTRTEWTDPLEFHTVNGGVTVVLPDGVGADLHAETLNGSIESDFPITVQGRFGPRRMDGTLGDGGPELRIETVNGSIRLRRSR